MKLNQLSISLNTDSESVGFNEQQQEFLFNQVSTVHSAQCTVSQGSNWTYSLVQFDLVALNRSLTRQIQFSYYTLFIKSNLRSEMMNDNIKYLYSYRDIIPGRTLLCLFLLLLLLDGDQLLLPPARHTSPRHQY